MWPVVQSLIGVIGLFSFGISISLFKKRNERKHLVMFGVGSLVLIILGVM